MPGDLTQAFPRAVHHAGQCLSSSQLRESPLAWALAVRFYTAGFANIEYRMTTKAAIELDAGARTFASGLLPALIEVLRRSRPGDLLAITSSVPEQAPELEAWCGSTRNPRVDTTREPGSIRWVVRNGEAPAEGEMERPIGSRL